MINKKYIRNCPTCKIRITYSNKQNMNNAMLKNTKCRKCTMKKIGLLTKKPIKRNCPICDIILTYSSRSSCRNAERLNSICKKCFNRSRDKHGSNNPNYKGLMNRDKWVRNCPVCNDLITYHNYEAYRKAKVLNYGCKCSKRGLPNYNPVACKMFEKINKTLNWNGKYAENGGEYYIKELGYFVDYYDSCNNLIIEYDEKYHKYQMNKDKERQRQIIKYLNCKFYRISYNDTLEFTINNLKKLMNL